MKQSIWIMCAAAMIARGQDVAGMGNFSHVVTNLDKSLEFYQGVLGLEPTAPPAPFDGNPAIQKLGNTTGSQSRYVLLRVPGSAVGDAVTLIGGDGAEKISVDDLAAWAGTVSYEILCGISKRVPRVYQNKGDLPASASTG